MFLDRLSGIFSGLLTFGVLLLCLSACAQETSSDGAQTVTEKSDSNAVVSSDDTNHSMETSAAKPAPSGGKAHASAQTPKAYIISPQDGATVAPTFKVLFGLSGMGVAPAGVVKDGTGHHHLLIDVDELPPLDRPLPSTDRVVHFGGGQTEAWVTLEPGTHTLQLLLGDFAHIPHATPVISERISITVAQKQ